MMMGFAEKRHFHLQTLRTQKNSTETAAPAPAPAPDPDIETPTERKAKAYLENSLIRLGEIGGQLVT